MKTLKTAILIVLMLAIGVCGYMVYQEYFEDQKPQEQPEQCEPQVTQLNDSTYHINISEDMCVTMMKDADTLNIDVVGARIVMANKDNDTVTIIPMYNLIYSDYFDSTRFEHINVRFQDD